MLIIENTIYRAAGIDRLWLVPEAINSMNKGITNTQQEKPACVTFLPHAIKVLA